MHLKAAICIATLLGIANCLPVTKQKANNNHEEEKSGNSVDESVPEKLEITLEYERYLKEIVDALETDSEFRQKLDKAPEADIRTGKIAQELEYVNHNVRSKLDEIKRRELERLNSLAKQQYELTNDVDRSHLKIAHHLDHENPHTFEINDLRKLILKTSDDLAKADQDRREEFKQYELQKEFERQETLRQLDEEHKKKFEEDYKKQQEKHNSHEKVHHPGNKAQLEEVWEKQDHMEGEEFNPKTFFMMHDVDGNGYWDENEVKALFINELNKVYQSGVPEDDMRERVEEMERMREHVFKEADTNHDKFISYDEFIAQTKRDEFQRDPGWDTVDNQPQFTHDEYLNFERNQQKEIQRLIAQGVLPPHPNMPQGYYPNAQGGYAPYAYEQQQHGGQYPPQQQGQYPPQHVQYQQQQPQYHPQQVQLNPNQVYDHHQPQFAQQQQVPQQHYQVPPQGSQQQPIPQQQQVPQQQVPQQQAPQQQVPQQQVPQQQVPQQPVPQQQVPQQQVPQQASQQQAPQQQAPQHAPQQQASQQVQSQQQPNAPQPIVPQASQQQQPASPSVQQPSLGQGQAYVNPAPINKL